MQPAIVEGIYLSEKAKRVPLAVNRAQAVAGRGLEGDRYFIGKGSFSHWKGTGRALTIVEAEALDDAGVAWDEARRNVVVRGVALNDLVGRRFRIGGVELHARRLCEPCSHLQKLTKRDDLMRALVHRGGIRVDILTGGEIAVGDPLIEQHGD